MMDAKKFLSEYQRMCDHYNDCNNCPLSDICCKVEPNLGLTEIDKIVDTVEKWTDEHKKVTRLDVFNGWLKEQGVDPDAYMCIDRMVDIKIRHSCFGFVCPINAGCKGCPNNGFWAKEVEVRGRKEKKYGREGNDERTS